MDESTKKYLALAAVAAAGFFLVRQGASVVLLLGLVLLMVKFRNEVAAAIAPLPVVGPLVTTPMPSAGMMS